MIQTPDPVSVAAESVTEPVTQADASSGEPAKLIAESTSEPVSTSDVSFGEPDSVCWIWFVNQT